MMLEHQQSTAYAEYNEFFFSDKYDETFKAKISILSLVSHII